MLVTVWEVESLLVQVTVVPTDTVNVGGTKAKPEISTLALAGVGVVVSAGVVVAVGVGEAIGVGAGVAAGVDVTIGFGVGVAAGVVVLQPVSASIRESAINREPASMSFRIFVLFTFVIWWIRRSCIAKEFRANL